MTLAAFTNYICMQELKEMWVCTHGINDLWIIIIIIIIITIIIIIIHLFQFDFTDST